MKKTNYQPDGCHTVIPYINAQDGSGLITFLQRVFDAKEGERLEMPNGRIMHAEVRIGDSIIMLSDACEQMGPLPASIYIYVEDVDAVFRKAVEAGGTPVMEPCDMFWGDRYCNVKDTWGNVWSIGTHIEDVKPEDLKERANAFMQQMSQ